MTIKIVDLSPKKNGEKIILVCPHAGGSPNQYRGWSKYLPDNISLKGLLLPGRDGWYRVDPHHSILQIAEELAAYIDQYLHAEIILFGHSMGALVAYEAARLTRKNLNHLIVSGHSAPHIFLGNLQRHTFNDDQLKDLLIKTSGTPHDVVNDKELMDLLLPTIRQDFMLCDTYKFSNENETILDCPITAFSGLQDYKMSVNDISDWSIYTNNFINFTYPGSHFFIFEYEFAVVQQIIQRLQETSRTKLEILSNE